MGKGKIAFERVPVAEVRRILEEQSKVEQEAQDVSERSKHSSHIQDDHRPSPSNVEKRRARPKRSIRAEGEDHPLGLWVDKEIFRKHQNRPPEIALHNPLLTSNNRYLALADSVLTQKKSKAKTEVNGKGRRARV